MRHFHSDGDEVHVSTVDEVLGVIEREYQQVIFETLALLHAAPIHEKADGSVNRPNGNEHVRRDAEGSDSSEKPQKQSERTEELSTNRQEGERLGNVQHAVHVTHRSGYPEASEPTEHFLRSMCEEND